MNIFYKSLINQVENKIAGYFALLNFRYQNLCVKADAASLMPVNVMMGGDPKNIEDVAKVGIADEYHLAVFPNQEDLQPFVIEGISHAHPEFILEVKSYQLNDEERHFLYYEMPKVDKNRHDVLTQGIKSLHDECKARIDEIYAENLASLTTLLKGNPEDLDLVKKELDRVHDDYIEKVKNLRDTKLAEVEEAFQRYLDTTGLQQDSYDSYEDTGYDVAKSLKVY